jgi:hypothetical protein
MSPSAASLARLTTLCAISIVGCAPSGNAGRTVHAGNDSTTDATQDAPPEAEALSETPATTTDSVPEPLLAPRPAVTAKPVYLPPPAGPYRVRVVDENHHDLPRFSSGGRSYVLGTVGARYAIVVANPTARRVEAVVSVDGLDAIDGHAANFAEKRGYILPAYGDTTIEGFRTSYEDVATFRFSSVADSYAGRLGQARDVGVIGVAFFPEQAPVAVAPPPPPPRPAVAPRNRYSAPEPASPYADDMASESSGLGGGAAQPSARSAAPATAGRADRDEPGKAETKQRPGLGTEFGEARASHVDTTVFERDNPSHPSQVVAIRYNDRAGLVALGIAIPQPYADVDRDLRLRETANPFRANRFSQPPP